MSIVRRFPPRVLWMLLLAAGLLEAVEPTEPLAVAAPAQPDEDFLFQGEYAGDLTLDGQTLRLGVQVVARGDGTFDAVAYPGGLPGDGWMPPDKIVGQGKRVGSGADSIVKLTGVDWAGVARECEIRLVDGVPALVPLTADGAAAATTLPKVVRESPTLGEPAPTDAVVIFDGPGPADERQTLVDPRITEDGLLMEGVTTTGAFGDARWHIEFRLPYEPHERGQARGNSGAYLLGAYEVQMLDSFGLEGKNNECGGIYKAAAPRVNACLPPLTWQTYDIDVTAPRFEDGRKVQNARVTVRHNGIVIHDDVEVSTLTPGGPTKAESATGPLYLQDHHNPVRYRNIWVLPKS